MEVVVTDQALTRLEESLHFYITELEMPVEKALEIKDKLFYNVKSLGEYPYKGQPEPYLAKLNQSHRRMVEGNFKIIYKIIGNMVYVTDFFDTRQKPDKLMNRNR